MDPRKILGVDANATQAEIQKAYRAAVRKHHPDMGGDVWAFEAVHQAYEMLIGESQREMMAQEARPQSPPQPTPNAAPESGRTKPSYSTQSRPTKQRKYERDDSEPEGTWKDFFLGDLPLQNQTTYFILVNTLDIFMTYILLRFGAIEANPVADFFMKIWGFNGMIAFKLVVVAAICVIAQIIAKTKLKTANRLLWVGTIIVGVVVVYSMMLFGTHFL